MVTLIQKSPVLTDAAGNINQHPLISVLAGKAPTPACVLRLLQARLIGDPACGLHSSGPGPALLALKEQLFGVLPSNCLQPLELSQPTKGCDLPAAPAGWATRGLLHAPTAASHRHTGARHLLALPGGGSCRPRGQKSFLF